MPAAAGKHCTGKHCTQRDYTLYTYHGPVIIEGILVETVISFEYNNNIWPRKRLWRKNNLSTLYSGNQPRSTFATQMAPGAQAVIKALPSRL